MLGKQQLKKTANLFLLPQLSMTMPGWRVTSLQLYRNEALLFWKQENCRRRCRPQKQSVTIYETGSVAQMADGSQWLLTQLEILILSQKALFIHSQLLVRQENGLPLLDLQFPIFQEKSSRQLLTNLLKRNSLLLNS